jgi:hypothetical protein
LLHEALERTVSAPQTLRRPELRLGIPRSPQLECLGLRAPIAWAIRPARGSSKGGKWTECQGEPYLPDAAKPDSEFSEFRNALNRCNCCTALAGGRRRISNVG